jgi:hypothetical protein
MAMEPTGSSIKTWLEVPRERLDVRRAITFIKALTEKVMFLHDHGVKHGGLSFPYLISH